MITTITFFINSDLQKKLLHEKKNAEKKQKIVIDIQNQLLIDKAYIDNKGNAEINIIEYNYHYNEEKNWKTNYNYFDHIITEKTLITFFENEERLNKMDEIIKEENKKEKEEISKKENEKFLQQQKEKKEEEEKLQNEIDLFIETNGSELVKLRKKLGYEYIDLAIQEKTDLIEVKGYVKIEWDHDKYTDKEINKPELGLLKAIDEILNNENVKECHPEIWNYAECDNWGNYEEKSIILYVKYNVFSGYQSKRFYIFEKK